MHAPRLSPALLPLHADFGVTIAGVDPRVVNTATFADFLHEAIDQHGLVTLPGLHLDDEAQLALTRRLGEPEPNHVILGQEGRIDYFGTIGNIDEQGRQLGNAHRHVLFQTGNEMWHSDSSFRPVPAKYSLLNAHEVPAEGGATAFASTRSAYARLAEATRARLEPLHVVHDYVFSRSKVAADAVTPSHAASLPPVTHRLVRANARHGARNLFIGAHAREIVGWPWEDSRQLLEDLQADATATDHVHIHQWQPGDLVIWDNRCMLHRGLGYDADRFRRRMRQTRVGGDAPSPEE